METFLTIILFTILGFWLLGSLGRWALRNWVAKRQREFQEQFGAGAASASSASRRKKQEGEVTITKQTATTGRSVNKRIGEYVEFEESESEETDVKVQ